MSVDELIKLMKERPVTKEDIKAFEARCKSREEQFQKEHDAMYKITNEWLNREYTI